MAKWLRQSTASQEIVIGRMVDSTDGNTAETALTIANTDIDIWKSGATTLADKNSGGATHIAGGIYSAVLDATDTNTLGPMKIFVQVSGALAWEDSYMVVPAVVYDAMILGTDNLDVSVTQFGGTNGTFASGIPAVNATQISGDATAADNLETTFDDTAGPVPWLGIIDQGTAQSATATTLVLRAAAAFGDDTPIGATLMVLGSTQGYWQTRTITDYVGSTDTATVDTWTVTPSGTITYKIFATGPASVGSPIAANVTQWNSSAVATPTVAGVPEVDITHIGGTALNTASAQLGVNVVQISGDGTAADNCESFFDGTGYRDTDNLYTVRASTAQAGATGTITLDASANANDDFYNNCLIQIIGGSGSGQSRFISDYTGASKVATVSPNWVVAPDNTSQFIIYPFGSIPGATAPTTADIWTYAQRRLTDATNITSTAGTIPITGGGLVSADVTAISTDTTAANNLEAALDGTGGVAITATFTGNLAGNVTGSVASVSGSVGSVAGAVGSVAGNVGGNVQGNVVGSVATVTNTVSANIIRVNGITVDGSGTTGDPWGPA